MNKFIRKNQTKLVLEYINRNNLTKKAFAEKCGLTIGKLNGFLENRNISCDTFLKLAKTTKISIDDLVKFEIKNK